MSEETHDATQPTDSDRGEQQMKHARDNRSTGPRGSRWLLRVAVQSGAVLAAFVAGIVLLGLAQRVGWLSASSGAAGQETIEPGVKAEYTCPMHPEIRQDASGKCPICGMTLVEVEKSPTAKPAPEPPANDRYICPMMCTPAQSVSGKCPVCEMDLVKADSGSGGERSVEIDSAARRILGIRTAEAKLIDVYRTVRTVGEIDYDQERVATIAAYVDGRLETMYAEYVGVEVSEGDALALVYSPQLYSAQVEYLSSLDTPALNSLIGGGDRLSEIARDNLAELGMSGEQIEKLRNTRRAEKRLKIASPLGGTVIAKHKVEGDYVKTGEPIYRVADLSAVWLMLDLYPSDAAVVRFGQQVQAELQSLPGEVYTGRVAFVDPMVDETTRTVRVRVEMSNFDGRLKPGDYATATIRVPAVPREQVYDPSLAGKWISPMHPQIIRSEPGDCPVCGMALVPTSELGYSNEPISDQAVLSVPRSAVLMAGDNSVVYVETKPGLFEIRSVTVTTLTDTQAVLLDGVTVAESVATDGNFLIDSQMQLGGKPSLMDPAKADGAMPTQTQGGGHAH